MCRTTDLPASSSTPVILPAIRLSIASPRYTDETRMPSYTYTCANVETNKPGRWAERCVVPLKLKKITKRARPQTTPSSNRRGDVTFSEAVAVVPQSPKRHRCPPLANLPVVSMRAGEPKSHGWGRGTPSLSTTTLSSCLRPQKVVVLPILGCSFHSNSKSSSCVKASPSSTRVLKADSLRSNSEASSVEETPRSNLCTPPQKRGLPPLSRTDTPHPKSMDAFLEHVFKPVGERCRC